MTSLSTSPAAIQDLEQLVDANSKRCERVLHKDKDASEAYDLRSKSSSSNAASLQNKDGMTSSVGMMIQSSMISRHKEERASTMSDLIRMLPGALQKRKVFDIQPGAFNDPVSRLFRRLEFSDPMEWKKYAHWNANKAYTRNLIDTDNVSYTLLLLCWNPGQYSPIHDHPCDACWMQVLQGSVRECRYQEIDSEMDHGIDEQMDYDGKQVLQCIADDTYSCDQLAYITDSMGYHRVGNPSSSQPAVTLHLYSPPFAECQTWASTESNPQINTCANKFDTEYGCNFAG